MMLSFLVINGLGNTFTKFELEGEVQYTDIEDIELQASHLLFYHSNIL